MAQKYYCIVRPEEWCKRYEDSTSTHFKSDGFTQTDGIGGDIVLTTNDEDTPDKHQYFLVTMEPILQRTGHPSEWGKAFLEEVKKADTVKTQKSLGVASGRKFRTGI